MTSHSQALFAGSPDTAWGHAGLGLCWNGQGLRQFARILGLGAARRGFRSHWIERAAVGCAGFDLLAPCAFGVAVVDAFLALGIDRGSQAHTVVTSRAAPAASTSGEITRGLESVRITMTGRYSSM